MKTTIRRIAAMLLVLVLTAGVSAGAVPASFADITDETTAVNADVLRLMGVVNGSGNNLFMPEGMLTRAQFCAMVIRLMGQEEKISSYASRTIFRDVAYDHWAGGYVNLAASMTVGSDGTRLISGVGDGRFLPDEPISCAQAITILLRVLGYGDKDAGAAWPQGYLNLAASLGLGKNITLSASQAITRAQAASLFTDMLRTENAAGQAYYATFGTVVRDVVLLAADGEDGALVTSHGALYPAVASAPTALAGHRGTLVLNGDGKVVTFLPEKQVELNAVVLKTDAERAGIRDLSGSLYRLSDETPVYADGKADTYGQMCGEMKSGMAVTVIREDGKITGIVCGYSADGNRSGHALVVEGTASAAAFRELTGGEENYRIVKDGAEISFAEIAPYDVVTYDSGKKVLTVSSLRISCVYEDGAPRLSDPETVTALGVEFPVMKGAAETIRRYTIGDRVCLLLTGDGKVAGMGPADLAGTAVGLAHSTGVDVHLPAGGILQIPGTVEERYVGRIVSVGTNRDGSLDVTAVTQYMSPGALDLTRMTLGARKVAANFVLYESFGGGSVTAVEADSLPMDVIPAEKVLSCTLNAAGAVDTVILDSVTGNVYTYGLLSRGTKDFYGSIGGTNTTVRITNGDGTVELIYAKPVEEGVFGGIAAGAQSVMGTPRAGDVVTLTGIEVTRGDFFDDGDGMCVRAGSRVYRLADEIHGYMKATKRWLNGGLGTILDYADSMTVYVDPIVQSVRIIEV